MRIVSKIKLALGEVVELANQNIEYADWFQYLKEQDNLPIIFLDDIKLQIISNDLQIIQQISKKKFEQKYCPTLDTLGVHSSMFSMTNMFCVFKATKMRTIENYKVIINKKINIYSNNIEIFTRKPNSRFNPKTIAYLQETHANKKVVFLEKKQIDHDKFLEVFSLTKNSENVDAIVENIKNFQNTFFESFEKIENVIVPADFVFKSNTIKTERVKKEKVENVFEVNKFVYESKSGYRSYDKIVKKFNTSFNINTDLGEKTYWFEKKPKTNLSKVEQLCEILNTCGFLDKTHFNIIAVAPKDIKRFKNNDNPKIVPVESFYNGEDDWAKKIVSSVHFNVVSVEVPVLAKMLDDRFNTLSDEIERMKKYYTRNCSYILKSITENHPNAIDTTMALPFQILEDNKKQLDFLSNFNENASFKELIPLIKNAMEFKEISFNF